MTNWDEVANKADIDNIDAKIGTSSDNETKQTLFGKMSLLESKLNKKPSEFINEESAWECCMHLPSGAYVPSICLVGDCIYLFKNTEAYSYNTKTKVVETKTGKPFYTANRSITVAVGTNIYLFGGNQGGRNNYKYNTLTDSYTKNADIPFDFELGGAVAIGTDIYLIGGINSLKNNYKYDTLSNTYTKNADLPANCLNADAIASGTNIYIYMGFKRYKYNTLTGNYEQLIDLYVPFTTGSAVNYRGCAILLYASATEDKFLFNPIEASVATKIIKPEGYTMAGAGCATVHEGYIYVMSTSYALIRLNIEQVVYGNSVYLYKGAKVYTAGKVYNSSYTEIAKNENGLIDINADGVYYLSDTSNNILIY